MQPPPGSNPIDGVLLLDKPLGLSSNTALQHVKRLFAATKAGHVGTLDPLATGLLPVCLGQATKFSTGLFAADKEYLAEVQLGVTTTTGDAEGETKARRSIDVDRTKILHALQTFVGRISQTPPAYSAIKRHGKPLYAYARAGEKVEIAPRTIVIHSIELIDWSHDRLQLVIKCGKGTYIRVLAEDIGEALGCGASLAGLRRTAVDGFFIEGAITLSALENMTLAERYSRLFAVDTLVESLPARMLDAITAKRLHAGQLASLADFTTPGPVRLYGPDRRFLGLGEVLANGALAPRRMVSTPVGAPADASATQIS